MKTLTERTLTGIKWSAVSVVTISIAQFTYMIIMSRLLSPSMFGVVALANSVIAFGNYFAQIGLGPAIIQRQHISEQDIKTSFSFTLFIGLFVAVFLYTISPYLAKLFASEAITNVIRVLSISLFFASVSSIPISLLRRNLEFNKLSFAEITSYLFSTLIIGILLATKGFGIWSLVVAIILNNVLLFIQTTFFTKKMIGISFNKNSFLSLINYGSKISLISILEFLYGSLPTWVIGKVFGSYSLGLYNRASTIIKVPANQASFSITKVLFPSLSEIQENKQRVKQYYKQIILSVGLLLFIFCFSIGCCANEIVTILLGDKWKEAIPLLRIIALSTPFALLVTFNGVFMDAVAQLKNKLVLTIIRFLILLLFSIIFISKGIIGFAIALLVSDVLDLMLKTFLNMKIFIISFNEIASIYWKILFSGFITYALLHLFIIVIKLNISSLPIIFSGEILISSIILITVMTFWTPIEILEFIATKSSRLVGFSKLTRFMLSIRQG
jgi:lipopolysaccharide exporter